MDPLPRAGRVNREENARPIVNKNADRPLREVLDYLKERKHSYGNKDSRMGPRHWKKAVSAGHAPTVGEHVTCFRLILCHVIPGGVRSRSTLPKVNRFPHNYQDPASRFALHQQFRHSASSLFFNLGKSVGLKQRSRKPSNSSKSSPGKDVDVEEGAIATGRSRKVSR